MGFSVTMNFLQYSQYSFNAILSRTRLGNDTGRCLESDCVWALSRLAQ